MVPRGAVVVVLVEGASDAAALATLAARQGRDLAAGGVEVVVLDGITNLPARLRAVDGTSAEVRVLVDENEAPYAARHLGDRGRLFVCDADLEDELIRALGVEAVLAVVERAGELRSFRTLRQQPAQRGWTDAAVLRRFMGSQSGRKVRYGHLLVDALVLDRVPAPLVAAVAET